MIDALKNWFLGLSRREQWLITLAAALVGLVLIGYIALFGWNLVSDARKDLDEAIQRRGRIEARLSTPGKVAARANDNAPAFTSGQSLESFMTTSAEVAGFELAQITARGDSEVNIRIASIKAGPMMVWLSQLEQQGLEAYELNMRRAEGGFVSADIGLRKR